MEWCPRVTGIPRIGSGATATLTRIKGLVKASELLGMGFYMFYAIGGKKQTNPDVTDHIFHRNVQFWKVFAHNSNGIICTYMLLSVRIHLN